MVFELIFIFRSPQFKFNFWQDIALKLFIFKTNLIQSVQGTQKRVFRAIRRNKNNTVGSSRGSPSLLKDDSQGLGQRITFGLGGHSMGPHLVVTVPYRAYSVLLCLVLFWSLVGDVYRCVWAWMRKSIVFELMLQVFWGHMLWIYQWSYIT